MRATIGRWWRYAVGILFILLVGVGAPILLLSRLPLVAVGDPAALLH